MSSTCSSFGQIVEMLLNRFVNPYQSVAPTIRKNTLELSGSNSLIPIRKFRSRDWPVKKRFLHVLMMQCSRILRVIFRLAVNAQERRDSIGAKCGPAATLCTLQKLSVASSQKTWAWSSWSQLMAFLFSSWRAKFTYKCKPWDWILRSLKKSSE